MDNIEYKDAEQERYNAACRRGRICGSHNAKVISVTFGYLGELSPSEIDETMFMINRFTMKSIDVGRGIPYDEYAIYLTDVFNKMAQQIDRHEPNKWAKEVSISLKKMEKMFLEHDGTVNIIQDTTGLSEDIIHAIILPYIAYSGNIDE